MCGMRSTLSYPLPLFRRSRPEDPQQHALVTYDVRPKLDGIFTAHTSIDHDQKKTLWANPAHLRTNASAQLCRGIIPAEAGVSEALLV